MGLLDFFTGGKNKDAIEAMKRAEGYFSNIQTPNIAQLTLPELQKYVEIGVMTPEQAQSYLQESNAYNDQNIDQTGTAAQRAALNQLSEIANAGAEGTPVQQAAIENAIQKMNTSVAGQRGAIEQQMRAQGIPSSLISAALQSQAVGQDASIAHADAMQASADNYQAALNALAAQGSLGNSLQGQMNAQANQVAGAQNAMQQFNAQNQQQASQFNAANRQDAGMYNAQNRQNVGNQNTQLANTRTAYNANLPQQVFNNQMSKAQGQAGAAQNIGDLYQKQGQQNAGLWGGIINTATSFIPKPGGAGGGGFSPQNPTEAGFNQQYQRGYAHGGIVEDPAYCAADGMMVPGEAQFPGDSEVNDTVPIMASPGEAVIPRSSVQENPEAVESLMGGESSVVDVQDVATLLKAMRAIRMGVV